MSPKAWVLPALVATSILATASGALDHASEHPQDGPHVDIRIVITDEAVRFESIINLAFADELVPRTRENLETIHPVEWAALERALVGRFAELIEVTVDGGRPAPEARLFEVLEPDTSLVALFPVYGARALTQVRMHWEHVLEQPPETVEIRWGAFPLDTTERRLGVVGPREILARLTAGGVQSVITFREEGEPFHWSAAGSAADHLLPVPSFDAVPPRTLPLLSAGLLLAAILIAAAGRIGSSRRRLLLAGTCVLGALLGRDVARVALDEGHSLPSEAQARAIFDPLHRNIYRAFDYSDEEDVYDALARCVDGELLERLYGEIYASLVQEEAGGAVGNVQRLNPISVEVTHIEPIPGGSRFEVDARWQVEGAVFHWGHSHWRVQELAARYGVRATDDGWRIDKSDVQEQILISATQDQPGEDGPEAFEIPDEL